MQAFDPVIIEDQAIRLHPLVCSGFNADFDGDTMSVHLPLSYEAQIEVRTLMMSVNNIFHPATGKSAMSPSQDMVLGIYYLTKERDGGKGEGMIFADTKEAEIAFENGIVEEQAKVKIRVDGKIVDTTVGRAILFNILPEGISYSAVNKTIKKKDAAKLIELCYEAKGTRATVKFLDDFKDLGYEFARRSGISLCTEDMHIPTCKERVVKEAYETVREAQKAYEEGQLSEKERYNKVIDAWQAATEKISNELMDELKECGVTVDKAFIKDGEKPLKQFNSLYMMADSGARGDKNQIRQASGMRGLMAKPSGDIVELPITASLREGLTGFQYFLACHGARKGRVDGPMKTPKAGYFTRRLVVAARDVTVTIADCGTYEGIYTEPLRDGTNIAIPIEDRIWGRYLADNVSSLHDGTIIASYGELVDDKIAKKIADAGIESVKVRSVLTCAAERGCCAKCYGTNIGSREPSDIGDAVGVIAAQSIGEPGTQLTLRTFHGGGTASKKAAASTLESKYQGKVRFDNIKHVSREDGKLIVMSKTGTISIIDGATGIRKDMLPVHYGYKITVTDGQDVEVGQLLAAWAPYSTPIVTQHGGTVVYEDIKLGDNTKETVDETGIVYRVITHTSETVKPKILVKSGESSYQYILSAEARLLVNEGDTISPGTFVASMPKEATKTMDITGGLPRVIELLEASKPDPSAILCEIDGEVAYGEHSKKFLQIIVTNKDKKKEYLLPSELTPTVYDGDAIQAGEALVDGPVNPHDIIRISGLDAVRSYIIDEVQKVYRSQGVAIHDKHFEVIVRQMTGFVKVTGQSASNLLLEQIVPRTRFQKEYARCKKKGKYLPQSDNVLLGLTQVPLLSESFLTAASFQRTTTVLANAAIEGRVDEMETNASRIIRGKRILSGTGLHAEQE